MNIVVDGESIIEYMKVMQNYLTDLKNEIKNMQDLKKNVIWESDTAHKAFELYDREVNEILSFGNKIIIFIDYLNTFLNNYDNSLEEIKGSFKKLNSEFNEMRNDI